MSLTDLSIQNRETRLKETPERRALQAAMASHTSN